MSPKVEEWGATGEALLAGATTTDAVDIAAVASKIQVLVAAHLAPKPPPVLLSASGAAQMLGPSFTAKWIYNHIKYFPPGCVRRIGGSLFISGPKLMEWACDTGQSVTRRR